MVDEQELNRKIAEWCGLKWFWNHNPECKCGAKDDDDSARSWQVKKDGEWKLATRFWNEDISFTTSLDSCFEYIVPKLHAWELHNINDTIYATVCREDQTFPDVGKAETPALALCRAVEKLIDGEVS